MNTARCAVHRDIEALGPCRRCGDFVCRMCAAPGHEGLVCPKCAALVHTVQRAPTPWERRAELGLGPALWQTWRECMFQPETFFRKLPPDGKTSDAMLYAWMISALIVVPNFLLQAYNFDQLVVSLQLVLHRTPPWLEGLTRWQYAAFITVLPLIIFPLSFYLGAAYQHLGCLIWGTTTHGFRGTARVLGYAQSAVVAVAIPLVGGVLVLYLFALLVIGIARTQETTVLRGLGAVLTLPILLGCCGGVAVAIGVFFVIAR